MPTPVLAPLPPRRASLLGFVAGVSLLYVAAGLWGTRGAVGAVAHVHGLLGLQYHLGLGGFALTPLVVLARIGYTAVALDVAAAMRGWGAAFGRRFRAALLAEGVFLIAFVWQAALLRRGLPTDPAPLSLGVAFEGGAPPWLHVPLQLVTAFNALYAVVLGVAFAVLEQRRTARAFGLALLAYGTALGLLVAVGTFLSLR